MRSRKKKPTEKAGLKRMNINISSELHDDFKAAVAMNGKKMTNVLVDFIQGYVEKYFPRGLKKGGR